LLNVSTVEFLTIEFDGTSYDLKVLDQR